MKHRKNRQFNCRTEDCGAGFSSMGALRKHKKEHTGTGLNALIEQVNAGKQLLLQEHEENQTLSRKLDNLASRLELAERRLEIIRLVVRMGL